MNTLFMNWVLWAALVLLSIQAGSAQDDVDGYTWYGRGSCQDNRGKMYSYLQRVMTFPNAETCGKQECERFGGMESYRGFEFSVAKRCTCLFDLDALPAVPDESEDPKYVSKMDGGDGAVAGVSGTAGTNCYQFGQNSAVMAGSMGVFTLLATATLYLML